MKERSKVGEEGGGGRRRCRRESCEFWLGQSRAAEVLCADGTSERMSGMWKDAIITADVTALCCDRDPHSTALHQGTCKPTLHRYQETDLRLTFAPNMRSDTIIRRRCRPTAEEDLNKFRPFRSFLVEKVIRKGYRGFRNGCSGYRA